MNAGKVQSDGRLPTGDWARRTLSGTLRHLLWRLIAPLPDAPYCAVKYLSLFGRLPDLRNPQRFTEKIQFRKLYDRNPLFPLLVDKIACKAFSESRVGADLVAPTLWSGTDLTAVDWNAMPLPVIVKPSHASGVGRLLRVPRDVEALLAADPSAAWLAIDHARFNREWAYREVEPRILIEPAILVDGGLPSDLRLYVFDGKVEHIEIDFTADGARLYDCYAPDWRKLELRDPLSIGYHEGTLDAPALLPEMLAVAEKLAAGLDFARVDLLVSPERFYVGEVTLYPGGGFDGYEPDSFDLTLGRLWRLDPVMPGAGRRRSATAEDAAGQSASRSR